MIRPEVYLSWNSRLSRCVWRKTRTRRSSSIAWLSRAVEVTYRAVRPAVATAAARYATPASRSGRLSPALQGRQGPVDAEGDQRRSGHAGGIGQDHGAERQPEPGPDGADQRAQQGHGAPPDGLALAPAEVGVVLVGGAERCAGHREISSESFLEVRQFRIQVPRFRVQAGDHVAVVAVPGQQLRVGSDGGDPAVLQQGHPVRQRHRGGPVRHDQRGGIPAGPRAALPRRATSVCTSRAESGSSNTSTAGLAAMARARAMRCRCPPERLRPSSPIRVSTPSGSEYANWAWATSRASVRAPSRPSAARRRARPAARCPGRSWRTRWCPRTPRPPPCAVPPRRTRAGPRRPW